jgi:polyisoprenoid-binding protein YceI
VLDLHGKCSGSLKGVLTIRDVSKDIELPVEIAKENNRYAISGGIQISWAEFNVEDPSILIARLDPTATISIQTTVPLKK